MFALLESHPVSITQIEYKINLPTTGIILSMDSTNGGRCNHVTSSPSFNYSNWIQNKFTRKRYDCAVIENGILIFIYCVLYKVLSPPIPCCLKFLSNSLRAFRHSGASHNINAQSHLPWVIFGILHICLLHKMCHIALICCRKVSILQPSNPNIHSMISLDMFWLTVIPWLSIVL